MRLAVLELASLEKKTEHNLLIMLGGIVPKFLSHMIFVITTYVVMSLCGMRVVKMYMSKYLRKRY